MLIFLMIILAILVISGIAILIAVSNAMTLDDFDERGWQNKRFGDSE